MKKFLLSILLCFSLHAETTTTSNMALELPIPGVTPGPDYAEEIVTAFNVVDSHDHTTGKGVRVPTNGININNDLAFGGYSGSSLKSVKFSLQNTPSTVTTANSAFWVSSGSGSSIVGTPLFNDNNGTHYLPILLQTPVTIARGDIFYAADSGTFQKLPIGSDGTVLKVSNGVPIWGASIASFIMQTKTSNYVLTSTDDVIFANNASSGFTLTLPQAASNVGKLFRIIATGASLANQVTIARSGSDAIDQGTSFTLATQNEEIEAISDGSTTWRILNRRVPSTWTAYTPTLTGFGTVSNVTMFWRREGDSIHIRGSVLSGTVSATAGSVSLPTGLTIDTTKAVSTYGPVECTGVFYSETSGNNLIYPSNAGCMFLDTGTSTSVVYTAIRVSGKVYVSNSGVDIMNSGDRLNVNFFAPITGWIE